jgi:hypothetical protein
MYRPEPTEISAALQELQTRWKNVYDARHQTWSGHFSGLMTFLSENPYLADILEREEQDNPVNFNDWWDEFQATGGSFVGTKRYSIPTDSGTKAILFYNLLRAFEAGTVNLVQFCVDAYGLSSYQEMTDTVNREIVSHVVEEMEKKLIELQDTTSEAVVQADEPPEIGRVAYVSPQRISELNALVSDEFDLARLVRLLEELNLCYGNSCFMSCAMLVRAITDHIPPIFAKSSFREVASSHGGRSFKESMEYLDRGLRKIADSQLHSQIRHRESLPTAQQIHFSPMLDVLLGEIIVLLT